MQKNRQIIHTVGTASEIDETFVLAIEVATAFDTV